MSIEYCSRTPDRYCRCKRKGEIHTFFLGVYIHRYVHQSQIVSMTETAQAEGLYLSLPGSSASGSPKSSRNRCLCTMESALFSFCANRSRRCTTCEAVLLMGSSISTCMGKHEQSFEFWEQLGKSMGWLKADVSPAQQSVS